MIANTTNFFYTIVFPGMEDFLNYNREEEEDANQFHVIILIYHNINISFIGHDNESILIHLDRFGVAASNGSACSSGSIEPSHVLQSLGLPLNKLIQRFVLH